jgi:hypothetical protein
VFSACVPVSPAYGCSEAEDKAHLKAESEVGGDRKSLFGTVFACWSRRVEPPTPRILNSLG